MRPITRFIALVALVAGLAAVPGTTPTSQALVYKDWGRARSPDHVLRRGCQDYGFRYRVNPPSGVWLAEIFLVGPDRQALGYRVFQTDEPVSDPVRGRGKFTVCRVSTTYGRHKLKMKITWYDSEDDPHYGWVRPTYFRMTRP